MRAMMFDPKYLPFVLAATLLMTSQPILTTLSKVNGHYQYVQVSTTLLAEATKLLLSALLYLRLPASQQTHQQLSAGHLLPFAVPGLIYFINNNLIFVILSYVNSTTYQILSSLKTVFTGILFRVVLHKKLTDLQWLAIVLLGCGTATSQIGTSACKDTEGTQSSAIGVVAAIVTCVLSALGGVYAERLMKHDAKQHSIHLQKCARASDRHAHHHHLFLFLSFLLSPLRIPLFLDCCTVCCSTYGASSSTSSP